VPVSAVQNVSNSYERLLTSDVLYSDSFQRPASAALTKANVSGVHFDNSHFALTPRYVFASYLRSLLLRVVSNGSSSTGNTNGGPVGTALLKVVAEPGNKELVPGSGITTVTASQNITFQVSVKNSGSVPVTKVKVRFIEQSLPPQTKIIKIINPGGVATVSFAPKSPTLGVPTVLQVRSVPVPHETNSANNTATYHVEYQG
jgi:uncharacterized repeat protein (TIGR01451 family)